MGGAYVSCGVNVQCFLAMEIFDTKIIDRHVRVKNLAYRTRIRNNVSQIPTSILVLCTIYWE